MYAIIETCGKQYKVSEGDVVLFEKLEVEEGKKVVFDNVILISDNDNVTVGTPYISGAKVEGKAIGEVKGKKVIVYKMKPKKNYRRKQGHRQPYTKIEISKITLKVANKTVEKAEKTEKSEKAEKVETKK